MNFSPVFAIGLLVILLVGVVGIAALIGLINLAMLIGPALIVVMAVLALIKAGQRASANGQVPPRS